MTRDEFQTEVGAYAAKLWPKLSLSPEQIEMWFHKLKGYTAYDARKVLGEAYASSKWKEPALADVVSLLKAVSRTKVKDTVGFPPALIEQVEREQREEAELLADWKPEDYENGKAEIIRNERGMDMMKGCPANGPLWIHYLVERYVYFRAMIFSHGSWSEVDRESYWAAQKPVPAVPLKNDASQRAIAQQAKVEINQEGGQ